MNTPPFNISALARRHGVSRKTIRRRLSKGWRPPPPDPAPTPPAAPTSLGAPMDVAPTPGRHGHLGVLPLVARSSWTPGAAILIGVALAIGALALAINGQTGWRFGTTPLAAITFASLSVAADVLAIVLPATAAAMWAGRRRLLAAAAWTTWTLVAAVAVLASLGFAELHLSDTAAGRVAVVATSTAAADQRRAHIAAAERVANAATTARKAECEIRGPKCRTLEETERVALAALTAAIAAPIPPVAPIADADPQVTAALRLTAWVGLKVTAADILNFRLGLMAMLPNIAGLVLVFGLALRRSPTTP